MPGNCPPLLMSLMLLLLRSVIGEGGLEVSHVTFWIVFTVQTVPILGEVMGGVKISRRVGVTDVEVAAANRAVRKAAENVSFMVLVRVNILMQSAESELIL